MSSLLLVMGIIFLVWAYLPTSEHPVADFIVGLGLVLVYDVLLQAFHAYKYEARR